jgi:hypothetical protein
MFLFLFRFRHVTSRYVTLRYVALHRQPPEIVSSNGTLAVTLDVGLVDSLAGIPWSTTGVRTATGYNGASMGPTLRVKAGDVLTVTLTNSLPPTSALDLELFAFIQDPDSDETNATKIYNRLDDIGNLVRTDIIPLACYATICSLIHFIHCIHCCRTTRSLGFGD